MTLDEEIYKQEEKAMTYRSMGNELSLCYSQEQQQRALEDYHMSAYHSQLAEWLKELERYRNVRRILSQNRIATDRYGEVVLWDDIKRVFTEVQDADSN